MLYPVRQAVLVPTHGFASINGLRMYYEIHGRGKPLILLHGGAGGAEMFSGALPSLSKNRRVVAPELQAHAHTADIDRPLRYELLADDVAALSEHLKLGRADVLGYSLGGGVALRMALQHPESVRKLVVVSAPVKRDGWYPEVQDAANRAGPESAEAMKKSQMYEAYAKSAPRPQDWPVLFTKLSEMLGHDYDWSKQVAKLRAPTMIAVGDADSVRTSHAVEFFELLGGGQVDGGWDGSRVSKARLLILPGTTHYYIIQSAALWSAVRAFLDEPMPKP